MENLNKNEIKISYGQLFLLTLAQLGGAIIIYLPGVVEAGRNVWISNIIASIMAYIVIYSHYLPLSLSPGCSMTKTLTKYWGKIFGGVIALYYLLFFLLLSCLILSDVYYFGKITMPETPGFVFVIFFLVPAVYAIKLGLEVMARCLELFLPWIVVIYLLLLILTLPKLDFQNLLPIMANGIKPVLGGALPKLNFPYAQILPIAFLYKYTVNRNTSSKSKFLKYSFLAILMATMLLNFRSLVSVAAFDEETLKNLTFPPLSAIRVIELGDVVERLDALLLATFYGTTFFKFVITFYVAGEIISDYFGVGKPRDWAIPLGIYKGISMPFLIPRFDIIVQTVVPYFILSLPLFFAIPLLLYLTIKIKDKGKNSTQRRVQP